MPSRFHVDLPLAEGHVFDLPADAVRHVQVLRLQAGAPLVLFNGNGGEWLATVGHIGRDEVQVRVGRYEAINRELPWHVTLAVAMAANDRMDALVEKATELGAAALQPLVSERSVLRLAGERAVRKRAHWQAIAVSACEQSGRTKLPRIEPVRSYDEWLAALPGSAPEARWVLSLRGARPLGECLAGHAPGALVALSGPEGGLTASEEIAAFERGFGAVNLGPRVLRADTAPLALLAVLAATP